MAVKNTCYHRGKRGIIAQTNPSDIDEKKEVDKMPKYQCSVCGYIYDPKKGDLEGSIKPGTPFEEIPDDWVCPTCGADKSLFERID